MSNYCILKVKTYETKAALRNVQIEHKRQKEYEDIYNELSFLNKNLTEHNDYIEMYNKALESDYYKTPDKYGRTHKEPKVKAIEIMTTFSPDMRDKINLDEWCKDNMNFIKDMFPNSLISGTLHQDQTTPHLHIMIIPITDKGKISKTAFINGKKDMHELQDKYAQTMEKHGLIRGEQGKSKHGKREDIEEYQYLTDKNKELESKLKDRKKRLEHIESRIIKALQTLSEIQTETETAKAKLEQVRNELKAVLDEPADSREYNGEHLKESDDILL